MRIFLCACFEINIRQGVQFIEYDVYIVTTDTRTLHGDTLSLICAGYRMKFAAFDLAFLGIKVRCHQSNPTGVANQDDLIG